MPKKENEKEKILVRDKKGRFGPKNNEKNQTIEKKVDENRLARSDFETESVNFNPSEVPFSALNSIEAEPEEKNLSLNTIVLERNLWEYSLSERQEGMPPSDELESSEEKEKNCLKRERDRLPTKISKSGIRETTFMETCDYITLASLLAEFQEITKLNNWDVHKSTDYKNFLSELSAIRFTGFEQLFALMTYGYSEEFGQKVLAKRGRKLPNSSASLQMLPEIFKSVLLDGIYSGIHLQSSFPSILLYYIEKEKKISKDSLDGLIRYLSNSEKYQYELKNFLKTDEVFRKIIQARNRYTSEFLYTVRLTGFSRENLPNYIFEIKNDGTYLLPSHLSEEDKKEVVFFLKLKEEFISKISVAYFEEAMFLPLITLGEELLGDIPIESFPNSFQTFFHSICRVYTILEREEPVLWRKWDSLVKEEIGLEDTLELRKKKKDFQEMNKDDYENNGKYNVIGPIILNTLCVHLEERIMKVILQFLEHKEIITDRFCWKPNSGGRVGTVISHMKHCVLNKDGVYIPKRRLIDQRIYIADLVSDLNHFLQSILEVDYIKIDRAKIEFKNNPGKDLILPQRFLEEVKKKREKSLTYFYCLYGTFPESNKDPYSCTPSEKEQKKKLYNHYRSPYLTDEQIVEKIFVSPNWLEAFRSDSCHMGVDRKPTYIMGGHQQAGMAFLKLMENFIFKDEAHNLYYRNKHGKLITGTAKIMDILLMEVLKSNIWLAHEKQVHPQTGKNITKKPYCFSNMVPAAKNIRESAITNLEPIPSFLSMCRKSVHKKLIFLNGYYDLVLKKFFPNKNVQAHGNNEKTIFQGNFSLYPLFTLTINYSEIKSKEEEDAVKIFRERVFECVFSEDTALFLRIIARGFAGDPQNKTAVVIISEKNTGKDTIVHAITKLCDNECYNFLPGEYLLIDSNRKLVLPNYTEWYRTAETALFTLINEANGEYAAQRESHVSRLESMSVMQEEIDRNANENDSDESDSNEGENNRTNASSRNNRRTAPVFRQSRRVRRSPYMTRDGLLDEQVMDGLTADQEKNRRMNYYNVSKEKPNEKFLSGTVLNNSVPGAHVSYKKPYSHENTSVLVNATLVIFANRLPKFSIQESPDSLIVFSLHNKFISDEAKKTLLELDPTIDFKDEGINLADPKILTYIDSNLLAFARLIIESYSPENWVCSPEMKRLQDDFRNIDIGYICKVFVVRISGSVENRKKRIHLPQEVEAFFRKKLGSNEEINFAAIDRALAHRLGRKRDDFRTRMRRPSVIERGKAESEVPNKRQILVYFGFYLSEKECTAIDK